MTSRLLGRLPSTPHAPCRLLRIQWGRSTETPETKGSTALACSVLFGLDEFRIGHRSSAVMPLTGADGFDESLSTADPAALRRLLLARHASCLGDRAWQARRALHLASWGESCVDSLPDQSSAVAITDREIVALAWEVAQFVRDDERPAANPDHLDWHGGLYCGIRNQHRLTVGVQLPWASVAITASYLGRLGMPGVLVQRLAEREVPYYAAAATPVVEHGTTCLRIALSTTTDHVVALLEVVRDVLRHVDIPASDRARLLASAALYEAVHPSASPFEQPAEREISGHCVPAVAVVGRLTEPVIAGLREVVHEW